MKSKKTLDELKEDVANGNLIPIIGVRMKMVTFTIIFMMILNPGKSSINQPRRRRPWQKEDLLQAPRRQKMVLRKMTSPVLHRCRIDRNIFTRHLPTDPIPYLSKSEKRQNLAGKKLPADTTWSEYTSFSEGEKPTEESIGISLDEAKKMVQEKVDKMGITDLQFSDWSYALCNSLEEDNSLSNLGSGYAIYYTRTINGIPITQTMADGGALEDMDSTMETWSYESLYFFVDKDGIESMSYSNPYTIGETKTENLNLLPFSEIMKTYEKMMVVTNADNMEYEKSRVYDIDRIVLGYARIYEPSTDPHTGLLVPVWDFFGSRKVEGDYDGNSYSDITDYPSWSFLTINAVDGSIIDRDLGY